MQRGPRGFLAPPDVVFSGRLFPLRSRAVQSIDQLSNCEFLFLDDIDKIKPTEGLQELLFAALDERSGYQNRKTIFTTNLSGNQLGEKWGGEYGPYLIRRLRDFCVPIDCDHTEGLDPNTTPNTPPQTQYEIERLDPKND